jgi:hypothetical protein
MSIFILIGLYLLKANRHQPTPQPVPTRIVLPFNEWQHLDSDQRIALAVHNLNQQGYASPFVTHFRPQFNDL